MSAKLPEFKQEEYPHDLELKLLQIVHRHGERSPVRRRLENIIPSIWDMCEANNAMFATITKFEKEKVQGLGSVRMQRIIETSETEGRSSVSTKPGSCYFGQLTNLGRYRMTLLGERIRDFYIKKLQFLPDLFDEEIIYVRSTEYNRTQESVQQLVAGGLYPEGKRSDNFTLKLHVRDPRDDLMFPNPNCYRLRMLAKEFNKRVSILCQDKFKTLSERFKKYVDEISLDSHPSANGVLDTLIAAKAHGYKLPTDIDDENLLRELEDVVVKEWFYGNIVSEEVRRLSLGRLMGEIRDRMINKINNEREEKLKLAIYSGHDTTVAPLLIILDAFDNRWPPFGSAILFELFKQKGTDEHFVRIKYNEKTLKLPGCASKGNHKEGDQSLCTLDAFKKIVKDQVPVDWEKECQL